MVGNRARRAPLGTFLNVLFSEGIAGRACGGLPPPGDAHPPPQRRPVALSQGPGSTNSRGSGMGPFRSPSRA